MVIEVRPGEQKIIDSPPFQRLRCIKQLAMTHLVFHGAEHTRFGHSLGVMHLVTRAYRSVVKNNENLFSKEKNAWHEQILRIIALVHDLGHAPFSHASEAVFPDNLTHEVFTEKIVKETCIADYINEIGKEFVRRYGKDYNITPDLICDIYGGRVAGENSEFVFLNTFMDSELDCDKMDYLLRDSLYCGVNYGKYDVERLISCLTVHVQDGMPRLAIESGGVQAFEEFVLARYFMFVQVYFHRTRRYFDIMLAQALKKILPDGVYPESVDEYLQWDDHRIMELMREKKNCVAECKNILERNVFSTVIDTKTHPQSGDIKYFYSQKQQITDKFGAQHFLHDDSADKMPHKIPRKVDIDNEKAIIIVKPLDEISTISEESHI